MALEQARKAAELGCPILGPALLDHAARGLRHDDLPRAISAGAQHADSVVMGQNQMGNRLVRDAADTLNHLACKARGGLRFHHHHALIANDDAGVWVTLGSKGVKAGAHLGERGFLFRKIALRCECLGHVSSCHMGLPAQASPCPRNRQTRSDIRRPVPPRAAQACHCPQ